MRQINSIIGKNVAKRPTTSINNLVGYSVKSFFHSKNFPPDFEATRDGTKENQSTVCGRSLLTNTTRRIFRHSEKKSLKHFLWTSLTEWSVSCWMITVDQQLKLTNERKKYYIFSFSLVTFPEDQFFDWSLVFNAAGYNSSQLHFVNQSLASCLYWVMYGWMYS